MLLQKITSFFLILAGGIFFSTATAQPELIFNSGFEAGTNIVSTGGQTDEFRGTDASVAKPNDWVTDFVNHPNVGIFRLYYEAGDDSQRKASIVADPVNPANKVLHYKILQPHINQSPYTVDGIVFDKKARIQVDLYGCNGLKEVYQSVRLFIPNDFKKFQNTKYPGVGDWFTLFEFWNNAHWVTANFPFRFGLSLEKKSPLIGSPFYFGTNGQKLDGGFKDVWKHENFDYEVPIGKWMTIEYYIKDGNKGNGRFYVAVTPEGGTKTVIFNLTDDTCHPDDPSPDGLSELNIMKLYTSNNMVNQMNSMGGVFQVYWDDLKFWKDKQPVFPGISVKQDTKIIDDKTGSFEFGFADNGAAVTKTFIIENTGAETLTFPNTPRITVTGEGFSLVTDVPASINAGASATFQVKFSPASVNTYSGSISIANNVINKNPYTFGITGATTGSKMLQSINFTPLPANMASGTSTTLAATATSGLPVVFSSSNVSCAAINGTQLNIIGKGTAIITASQPGNSSYAAANAITQLISVDNANIIANSNFNTNITGWDGYRATGTNTSNTLVDKAGYVGKACKINIENGSTANWHVQFAYLAPIVLGKKYLIRFKASADADRVINFSFQRNVDPKTTYLTSENINITTTPTTYGPYYFTSTASETNQSFRFLLGNSNTSVYIDDVEIVEIDVPAAINEREVETPETKVFATPGGISILAIKKQNYRIVTSAGQEVKHGTCHPGNEFISLKTNGLYIVQVNNKAFKVLVTE